MSPRKQALVRSSILVGPFVLMMAGCDSGQGDSNNRRWGTAPTSITTRLQLRAFESCEALERHIEDSAVEEMRVSLDQLLRGDGAFADSGRTGGAPQAGAPTEKSGGSGAVAPSAYTKTNNQVVGVDEADFVKNDGSRIFVLSGQRLYATQSWPPQDMSLKASLVIEGQPREMFFDDKANRVMIISEVFAPYPDASGGGSGGTPAPKADLACPADAIGTRCGGGYGMASTKVTVVDVSNLSALESLDAYYFPGAYTNSRRIGTSIRLVLSDRMQVPAEVQYWPTSEDPALYTDKTRLKTAIADLKRSNEKLIRARTLEQWIPTPRMRRVGSDAAVSLAYDCKDFSYSNAPVRSGIVTVATLNLSASGTQISRTTLLGEPGEIYASPTALYIANRHWWWWPEPGHRDYTYLHKLDISQPDRAIYRASGGVEGHILNQFAIDEYQGHLRVATTIDSWVAVAAKGTEPATVRMETTNRVSVLSEQTGALVLKGQTQELAKGERIYSARFVGARGFVVTFRQVDPLFTFDLSNPLNPRMIGQLKVPGFSTYIHPLGDNHLLTIGVQVPEPDALGRVIGPRSLKLSIFDVTNFAAPREAFTQLIGTSSADSEALHEHKAFNYFPEKKLLAIPFSDYGQVSGFNYWDSFVSDLRVFDIDPVKGITRRGVLDMKDMFVNVGKYAWDGYYTPWIRRSVMAADPAGNDFVYAISDAGIRVANAKSLATPLQTAMFEP